MNTINTLYITIQDPQNYSGDGNVQYRTPSLEYNADHPSLLVTRYVPIGRMTNAHLNEEFAWMRDRLAADLINMGVVSNLQNLPDFLRAMAVVQALSNDMTAAHPDFLPEGVDPNAV